MAKNTTVLGTVNTHAKVRTMFPNTKSNPISPVRITKQLMQLR